MTERKIILASASPRRRALLEQIGVVHEAVRADIDETPRQGERARDYALRLSRAKARAVLERLPAAGAWPVLGADTVVESGGEILTKPRNQGEGMAMLEKLSGKCHHVYTAVTLLGEREHSRLSETRVTFRDIAPGERLAYWQSGEPRGKAGGYAIQGLGAVFVRRIEGSYSGVMGLPLFETAELLERCGIRLLAVPHDNFGYDL